MLGLKTPSPVHWMAILSSSLVPSWVGLAAVVVCRDGLEGLEPVRLDVLLLHAVQVVGLRVGDPVVVVRPGPLLLIGLAVELERDVVEGDVEAVHAELADLVELGDGGVEVGVGRVAQVQAGRQRVGEVDVVGVCDGDELLDLGQGVAAVQLAPLGAQERVVLGRVDVGVHLVLAVVGVLVETRLVRPGNAVEALDGAADGHERPVAHRNAGDMVAVDELAESLRRVEGAAGVDAVEDNAGLVLVVAGRQDVALVGEALRRLARQRLGKGLRGGIFRPGAKHDLRPAAGGLRRHRGLTPRRRHRRLDRVERRSIRGIAGHNGHSAVERDLPAGRRDLLRRRPHRGEPVLGCGCSVGRPKSEEAGQERPEAGDVVEMEHGGVRTRPTSSGVEYI
jgi:hypothetical protein